MRRLALAAALLGVAPLADAQVLAPASSRTYIGCDALFCARVVWNLSATVVDPLFGHPLTTVSADVWVTARPALPGGLYTDIENAYLRFDLPAPYESDWGDFQTRENLFVGGGLQPGATYGLPRIPSEGEYRGRGGPPRVLEFIVSSPPVDPQTFAEVNIALTPTPEPATLALAGVGVILLGTWARRRATAAPHV